MRIAIDNRVIKFSGIGIYNTNLSDNYIKLGHKVFLYDDELKISRSKFVYKYINFFIRIIKENSYVNKWLHDNSIDIYHVTKNFGVPLFSSIPIVVTIHDIIPHLFPQQYLKNTVERIYYEMAIRHSIKKASKILTVSAFSKQELIKAYGVKADKIIVIANGYNEVYKPIKNKELLDGVKEKYRLRGRYILTFGGSEYRKNVKRLINVYQKHFSDEYKLVVIGGKWRDIDLASEYKTDSNILFLSNVPEQDLIAIYNLAEIFVFPSFYEGFGIPVLEGMACGVPVITSDVSSMPEVGGDAAIYFDPYDEKDMAEKIELVLKDDILRQEMISKGLKRVKEYSWEKCAKETLKVYGEVLHS